ncbi:MAG: flagellar export protein FliJ [Candidatus Lustribacter sp.]|jgi:flagellar FliJ protein
MPRFAFRLDPVLDYRQRLEDEQQIAFAAALSTLRSAEAVRDDYLTRRAEMRQRLLVHHSEMESVELRATYAHCDYLDRSIVSQERVVEAARAAADQERAKLVLKSKDKKILATLKERRRETFEFELAAREQRESDDINSRVFDRATTLRETPS